MSNEKFYIGKVIWFNNERGFGFIDWNIDGVKQKDMFVHFSDILCDGFKTLKQDQLVKFQLGKNHKGDFKAISVDVI